MWDDLRPYLVGTGPTATVLDPDGTPNHILDSVLGGTVRVNWSFAGPAIALLGDIRFTVTLYADPVSTNPKLVVGTFPVTGGPTYSLSIPIAPASLPPDAYRLTTLITCVETSNGLSLPVAAFVDGPIIQVRPGP